MNFNFMKKIFVFILLFIGLIAISILAYNFFYYKELREIRDELQKIKNVEVINIWGSDDITLEEISARIKINNKYEIVLGGLSKDVYNYPETIYISEINGYSFTNYDCSGVIGIGNSIDIGSKTEIGKKIGVEFNSPTDIVSNIELISNFIDNLKKSPELNYFQTGNNESYILVEKKKTEDNDPLLVLENIEDKSFEFAKKLKWKNKNCCN